MNGKMKFILVMILIAELVCIMPVSATGHAQVIKFVEKMKNPDGNGWFIPPDAAVGSLMYQDSKFVFNGHGLPPETGFTLIEDPWSCPQSQMGNSISDKNGNILIKGGATSLTYDLQHDNKWAGQTGDWLWLVPTSDLQEWEGGCIRLPLPWERWWVHYLFAQELISPP